MIDNEPDAAKQDETREELLKLSGQWLKLCDVHSKKVVKINPQWYQFRSNVPSTKLWITYMDKHLRQVEPESGKVRERIFPLNQAQGWKKKYRTTRPLVAENFLSSPKIFSHERKKKDNCKNLLDKRRNSEKNSN